jgi:hypothetical protein
MSNDFLEDGLNRMRGYRGWGGNKLGLRDREDEIVVMPHNSPGARGHIINHFKTVTRTQTERKEREDNGRDG